MNIKEFAQKFIEAEDEAWKNGNLDKLEELEDPNVAYHMLPPNLWDLKNTNSKYLATLRRFLTSIRSGST